MAKNLTDDIESSAMVVSTHDISKYQCPGSEVHPVERCHGFIPAPIESHFDIVFED